MQIALSAREQELQQELALIRRCWTPCSPTCDVAESPESLEQGQSDACIFPATAQPQYDVRELGTAGLGHNDGHSQFPTQQGKSKETLDPNQETSIDSQHDHTIRAECAACKHTDCLGLEASSEPAALQKHNGCVIQSDVGSDRPGIQNGIGLGSTDALRKQLAVVCCLRELEASAAFQSR